MVGGRLAGVDGGVVCAAAVAAAASAAMAARTARSPRNILERIAPPSFRIAGS